MVYKTAFSVQQQNDQRKIKKKGFFSRTEVDHLVLSIGHNVNRFTKFRSSVVINREFKEIRSIEFLF